MSGKEIENGNLVHDGIRVLGSMGDKACPLGCIYCFVNAPGYQGPGKVDTPDGMQELAYNIEGGNIKIIQPVCDMELFLVKNWPEKLMQLTTHGLSIDISTKLALEKNEIEHLKAVDQKLKEQGALLHVAVSLTRLHDWKEIEQFTPSSEQRIVTAQKLSEAGIATSIALRPTLPFVSAGEFEELIQRTAPFVDSYLSGPLYLTPKMKQYMNTKHPDYQVEIFSPKWMKGKPKIEAVNTYNAVAVVKGIAAQYERPLFDSTTQVVEYSILKRRPKP